MGLFDNEIDTGAGLLIGIGAIILASVAMPIVAAAARPIVKAGIKGGLILHQKSRQILAETQEMVEDLTAEVKTELMQD